MNNEKEIKTTEDKKNYNTVHSPKRRKFLKSVGCAGLFIGGMILNSLIIIPTSASDDLIEDCVSEFNSIVDANRNDTDKSDVCYEINKLDITDCCGENALASVVTAPENSIFCQVREYEPDLDEESFSQVQAFNPESDSECSHLRYTIMIGQNQMKYNFARYPYKYSSSVNPLLKGEELPPYDRVPNGVGGIDPEIRRYTKESLAVIPDTPENYIEERMRIPGIEDLEEYGEEYIIVPLDGSYLVIREWATYGSFIQLDDGTYIGLKELAKGDVSIEGDYAIIIDLEP